jgi:hypothetical protein
MMSTKHGFVQGYNVQAVANAEQVIVAAAVTAPRPLRRRVGMATDRVYRPLPRLLLMSAQACD